MAALNEQLSLELARRWGRKGTRAAQIRAENAEPGFTLKAAAFVERYLRTHGPMPGEMLVDLAIAAGHVPPDGRAFGAVFKYLLRHGAIRQCGWCLRRKGHGTGGGRVWSAVQ